MLFYWAAAAALISFSYFLAAFFLRTQLASLLSPLIYFLAMLPALIAVSFQVRTASLPTSISTCKDRGSELNLRGQF